MWVNVAFLAGGLLLLVLGTIAWQIPTSFLLALGACSTLAWFLDPVHNMVPGMQLLSGATMLGAFFIATDPVTSPTFTIYTLHQGGRRTLVHLDAYRLDTGAQIDSLMLEDFLVSPYCLAVEWPEKIADWIPSEAWHLELGITADEHHTLRLLA
jgi:hypothetical protein